MLEGLVFIPVIVIEGMLVNTELFLSGGRDVGDIFPFDSIILLTLDAFLYIKLKIAVSRNIHSTEDGGWVDVAAMAWAIALIVYELLLCVLFILFHLETIDRTAMQLTRELLAKEPEDRPPTAKSVADRVEALLVQLDLNLLFEPP